jgi:hypothetical protein
MLINPTETFELWNQEQRNSILSVTKSSNDKNLIPN